MFNFKYINGDIDKISSSKITNCKNSINLDGAN